MSSSPLLQPLTLGPFTLKNRIFLAALTRNRNVPGNVPIDLTREYYELVADGGCGLIVTEGTLVTQQGTEWPHAPGIWSEEHVAGWKKVTEGVHAKGGVIFAQLWHAGRTNHPDMPEQIASGEPVYGPSAIGAEGGKFRLLPGAPGYVTPTAIEDPAKIVELFRLGAINAKKAGFDGVEIHGANGYLISQFLDSGSNKRTDKWGGSPENRARFPLEILKALIEVFGADRVGAKFTPGGGYNDIGMPLEETIATFSYLLTEIEKLGLLYVCLCRYLAYFDPTGRGTEHDVIKTYGHLLKNTVLFANGGYQPEEAAKAIGVDNVQGIFFGAAYLAHPDLPKRVEHGIALDNVCDFSSVTLYGDGTTVENQRKAYTDWPLAKI